MDTAVGGTHPIGMHSCDSCFFSFRFPEIFAYAEGVEVMQENLNELIEGGVPKITTLVRNTEKGLVRENRQRSRKNKNRLETRKNGNKNINFDTSHSEQFSVEKTKDNFNAKSRTTLKENGNPDIDYYKPKFADYIKKVMQARKGNS